MTLDLGSSHLVLGMRHRETILRERSRILIPKESASPGGRRSGGKKGSEGLDDQERETLAFPVRHGRVVDPAALDPILESLMRHARKGQWLSWAVRGTVGVIIPPVLEEEALWRMEDVLHRHGLAPFRMIDLGMALAFGCGLDSSQAQGRMVVDIGGGKTYMAAYSLGGVVAWHWADVGAESLERALMAYVEKRYQVRLPLAEAERIKIELGGVYPPDSPRQEGAVGVQTRSGLPQKVSLDDGEVRDILADCCEPLVMAIQQGFKSVPPELVSDIAQSGVLLAGGGSLLRGLPEYLAERLGLPVRLTADPLNAVILGGREFLKRGRSAATESIFGDQGDAAP